MPSIIGYAALSHRHSNLHSNEGTRVKHIIDRAIENKDWRPEEVADKIVEVILEASKTIGIDNAIQNVAYCVKNASGLNAREIQSIRAAVYTELEALINPFK